MASRISQIEMIGSDFIFRESGFYDVRSTKIIVLVGWVERSATHQYLDIHSKLVGSVLLHSPYILKLSSPEFLDFPMKHSQRYLKF